MVIKVHYNFYPLSCINPTPSGLKKKNIARNINDIIKTGINFKNPRWQLSAILITGSWVIFTNKQLYILQVMLLRIILIKLIDQVDKF